MKIITLPPRPPKLPISPEMGQNGTGWDTFLLTPRLPWFPTSSPSSLKRHKTSQKITLSGTTPQFLRAPACFNVLRTIEKVFRGVHESRGFVLVRARLP
jgi:hypothetical protein